MNNQIYTSTISSYFTQIFPEGPLAPPNQDLYREISKNLQPLSAGLQTGFAIEVIKYIQHFHCFDYRSFLGMSIVFSLVIDIHPINSFNTLAFSLQYNYPDNTPKYFIHWNYLPCAIPHIPTSIINQSSSLGQT